jgi:HAD superfamily hydrolase (TIGR01549 family)
MAKPKAVIFDIDGTLIDSVDQHAQAWVDAFREFGHSVEFAEIRSQIGKGGDQILPQFLSKQEQEEEAESLNKRRSEIFHEKYLEQIKGFPKVRDLFEELQSRKIEPAVASSANPDDLKTFLWLAGVDDLVETGTSSGDAEKSKPHPDIFEAALERLGKDVTAQDVVVVGDTPYDAEAAHKAGITSVGVLCGGFPEHDLRKAGCVAIYQDPADLLAQLEGSALIGGTGNAG